ncbi:Os04g0163150 [Oryza sativa Japonica Group]|nr:hypothetical protein OsJ_13766 [Oryza sativa Japonica Group]KAF2932757.1 hypothetical protein DAI22_04g023100 [Oryza sativa Japonica Group]BAS87856.1 Os04g0163150 [Oryza sativa Japonica Group]
MRAPPLPPLPAATTGFSDLQPELMGEIHGRLSFLDHLAFAAASSAATRDAFKPEPPWLVIPGDTPGTATVFSTRVAPSLDSVEDAIHHEGKFLSVTYTGIVEAWERDGVSGEFTSNVVTTRMADGGDDDHRKYLAAAPDGRLMIVLKNTKRMKQQNHFKVQVFDEMTQRWEAAEDIGELPILVGVNSSLCVSTAKHPEINAGCVYYTDDDMWEASMRRDFWCSNRKPNVGAYSLKDGKAMSIPGLGEHLSWPPPAWFTPSFPR